MRRRKIPIAGATLAAESGSKVAKSLLREMELFVSKIQLAKGRKRSAEFKPGRGGLIDPHEGNREATSLG